MNRRDAEDTESLHTKRCVLIPFVSSHQNDIFKLYCNTDVQQYLGGVLDDEIAFSVRFAELVNEENALNRAAILKDRNHCIGMVCVGPDHDKQDYEVGFKFLPQFWGLGLAQETVVASIDDAKSKLNLKTIVSETQQENLRSRRFLEKLGFEKEKMLTRHGAQQIFYRKKL